MAGGWKLDADGMLPIPDGPGLGIEINLDSLRTFTRADTHDVSHEQPRRSPLVAYLWIAFAVNYVDRQMVYSMFPALRPDLGFTARDSA